MTAPRAPHVLPASQHEPGAGSGSVSRQSSPQPCQGDNLGHICPGKGLKGSSQVWFPSGKTPSFIDCSYPQLGVHWRGSAPQGTLQKWDIYPEQTFGLKGVVPVLAGSFLVHHLSSHFLTSQNKLFPCLLIHRFLWPWVFRYHTHRAATVGVVLAGFREQNESVLPILRLRPQFKDYARSHLDTLACTYSKLHSFGKPGLSEKAEALFPWHSRKEGKLNHFYNTFHAKISLLLQAFHSDQGSGHTRVVGTLRDPS